VNLQELYLRYEPLIRPALRIGPLVGGAVLLAWRVRETRVPVTPRSILIPPVAMSTGAALFLVPMARVPWLWAVGAFFAGLLVLSWPLVRSSRLESRDGVVYLKRSRAFLAMLLGLLALRLLLHEEIGHLISPLQTAGLFFLLAFGMIVHWRVRMYRDYRAMFVGVSPSAGR
jgi:membrane protein CcdC involved in cytochrome C biogenesis